VAALGAAALAVLGLSAPTASARPATAASSDVSAASSTTADAPKGAFERTCDAAGPGEFSCFALRRTDVGSAKGLRPALAAPTGFGPSDLQSAYGLPADGGAGRTVAIVDAYDDPTAEADLAVYRQQYGLPACTTGNGCFRKADQRGGTGYPAPDSGWAGEISLDLDMVSAIAPDAHILLVEADDSSDTALGAAVDEAVALGAQYVSNSYGTDYRFGSGEDPSQTTALDPYYDHPGVAIVASSGDYGYGVSYPAASPYVTSVGGTSLVRDPSAARGWSESAWNEAGSGCSLYEPKPAFQTDTGCADRTVADVSAVADPATGVAVYQTYGASGWSLYGGTSVSSPIIAGVYADAAAPAAGTYPNSYPYAAGTGLNDVSGGSNGDCSPSYLCHGAAGYDGPTGLGTPAGLQAFRTGPHGQLTGTVTDRASGKALAGAVVSDGTDVARTDAQGRYTLTLPAGRQDLKVTAFGYADGTASGVTVTQGATATKDFALRQLPSETVSGTVADGSGHDWPLYAKITVDGNPNAAFTDPVTGAYRLTLPQNSDYTLHFAADAPGYDAVTKDIHVARASVRADVPMTANPWTATAPGYRLGLTGPTTPFDSTTSAPDGWTVANAPATDGGWEFDDPGGRTNETGGTGGFAIADSNHWGFGSHVDTSLISPVFDFSADTTPEVAFDTMWTINPTYESFGIDASDDGGATWNSVWTPDLSGNTYIATDDHLDIPLAAYAGKSAVQLRFHYVANGGWYWGLDNVFVGQRDYLPVPGGLVTGTVSDANTGQGAVDATVADHADPSVQAPTVRTPDDPALPDGHYSLFVPGAGSHRLTAAKFHYSTAAETVKVRGNSTVAASYQLAAGRLRITPGTLDATAAQGRHTTRQVRITNTGTATATLTVGEQAAGTAPDAPAGAPVRRITGDHPTGFIRPQAGPPATTSTTTSATTSAEPAAVPAADPWQSAPALPVAVMDNALDSHDGKLYSSFGDVGLSFNGEGTFSDLYVLDPAAGAWTHLASAQDPRQAPGHGFVGDRLYIAGGWGADGNPDPKLEIYDTASNTWTTGADEPRPHAGAGSAVLDGKLYLVGGCDIACGTTDVSAYDPATDSWTQAAPYPEPVSWTSCAGIGGKLYCAGGATDGGDVQHAYVYDPAADAWSALPDIPLPLWGSSYAAANGQLLVSGGVDGDAVTNQGFAYDPAAGTWSALPNATTPTYRGGGALGFYKAGGSTGGVAPTTAVEALPGFGVDTATDVPWLGERTQRLTLRPGASTTLTVSFDAKGTAPGDHTAALTFGSTTPYPLPALPVTFHVTRH
jgi:hypothetical protein